MDIVTAVGFVPQTSHRYRYLAADCPKGCYPDCFKLRKRSRGNLTQQNTIYNTAANYEKKIMYLFNNNNIENNPETNKSLSLNS